MELHYIVDEIFQQTISIKIVYETKDGILEKANLIIDPHSFYHSLIQFIFSFLDN